MSEEETLIEETPVEETSTEETAVEETPVEAAAEGEKPEWLKDKYKSVEDQAKAYSELEKKLGGYTGSPDKYEVSLPEGIEGEFDLEDPRMTWFQEAAKQSNMSQETFSELLHGWIKQEVGDTDGYRKHEMQALGTNAQARLRDLGDWGKANLNKDQFEGFKALATSASGVEVLETLVAKSGEGRMPKGNEVRDPGMTKGSLDELLRNPKYMESPVYRKEVEQKFKDFYGD
tara:strand:+ start:580 stop:1272 length:693 start_codon:yes stop_codon:yes gene_type:complete